MNPKVLSSTDLLYDGDVMEMEKIRQFAAHAKFTEAFETFGDEQSGQISGDESEIR